MSHEAARKVAVALIDELRPAVDRIEAAGSLRRQALTVAEIDLIAIPRIVEGTGQVGLFDGPAGVNAVWQRIERMGRARVLPVKPTTTALEDDELWYRKSGAGVAKRLKLWLPRAEIVVDLYLTTAEQWGVMFAIRTGAAEFAQALVSRWTSVSRGHVHEGRLHPPCPEGAEPVAWHVEPSGRKVPLGTPYETPEERDVFEVLGLRYVPPALRRDATALRGAVLSPYVREGHAA